MYLGDYHTHTLFSHGKGSIEDNCKAAVDANLKQVAICDHGFSQWIFGMSRRDHAVMRRQIDELNNRYAVKILLGIEVNVCNAQGDIDISIAERSNFDLVALGYHDSVRPTSFASAFSYNLPMLMQTRLGIRKSTYNSHFTKSLIKAIEKNKVSFISHLNYKVKVDVKQIGQCCNDYGTAIELSARHNSLSDEDILLLQQLGCKFIVNSDAHTPKEVGDFLAMSALIEKLKLNKGQILNWDNTPIF